MDNATSASSSSNDKGLNFAYAHTSAAEPAFRARRRRPVAAKPTLSMRAKDAFDAGIGAVRSPLAKHSAAILTRTAVNVGVSATASVAAALTVAPFLLSITAETASVAAIYQSIPLVGGMLAAIVGTGGVYGCMAAAGCMLSLALALFSNQTGWQESAKRYLAQMVQGLAIAPLLLMAPAALGAAAPAVALALGCTLGISLLVAIRAQGSDVTPAMAIATMAMGVASAPIAARLALGIAAGTVVADAIMFLGAGCVMGAMVMLSNNWAAVKDDSTTFLWRSVVKPNPGKRLDSLGNANPSVFLADTNFEAHLRSLDSKIRAQEPVGLYPYLLSGPAGTGKTDVAQALANQWGLRMFAPKAALLAESEHPAEQVTQYFEEARLQAERDGKPVVLFFDEAEKLFTDRRTLDSHSDEAARAYRMTLAFNTEIEGVQGLAVPNIIVIAATNHVEKLEPSIRSRFGATHLRMTPPGPEQFANILTVRWTDELSYHPTLRDFAPFEPTDAQVERMSRDVQRLGKGYPFVGRDLIQCIKGALVSVQHKAARMSQAQVQEALVAAFAPAFERQMKSVYGAPIAHIGGTNG